jgi:hypothetical protein
MFQVAYTIRTTERRAMAEQPKQRLTEEELKRWWPFDRLDPKLMPKPPKKQNPQPEEPIEEAWL